MKFICCNTYDALSEQAAEILKGLIREKPNAILGLATGSTPVGTYRALIRANRAGELDFSAVRSFNLDEYFPISQNDAQSYYTFMRQNLFDHVNIRLENTKIPNGEAKSAEAECALYEASLAEAGYPDLQILGIGENGHIGFNEPSDRLSESTHTVDLAESTIAANARFFDSQDDVPRRAITMGMGSILKSKKILLLVSGKKKHGVLNALFDASITTHIPATLLKLHPDVTVLYDLDAKNG